MSKQIREKVEALLDSHHSDDAFVCDTVYDRPCDCWVAKATTAILNLLERQDRESRDAFVSELLGELDTMPHYIRSKFADHVEVTKEDYAEMLLADEVKRIVHRRAALKSAQEKQDNE